jgi:hypothetical protein
MLCTLAETSSTAPLVSSRVFDPDNDTDLAVFQMLRTQDPQSTECVKYDAAVLVSRQCPGKKEYVSVDTPMPTVDDGVVFSTIEVPAQASVVAAVTVTLDIEHTYVAALEVALEHSGNTTTLWNEKEDSGTSISQAFDAPGFGGEAAQGAWVLSVTDSDAYGDTGELTSWSLVLHTCP